MDMTENSPAIKIAVLEEEVKILNARIKLLEKILTKHKIPFPSRS